MILRVSSKTKMLRYPLRDGVSNRPTRSKLQKHGYGHGNHKSNVHGYTPCPQPLSSDPTVSERFSKKETANAVQKLEDTMNTTLGSEKLLADSLAAKVYYTEGGIDLIRSTIHQVSPNVIGREPVVNSMTHGGATVVKFGHVGNKMAVSDNGSGIASEDFPKVTKPGLDANETNFRVGMKVAGLRMRQSDRLFRNLAYPYLVIYTKTLGESAHRINLFDDGYIIETANWKPESSITGTLVIFMGKNPGDDTTDAPEGHDLGTDLERWLDWELNTKVWTIPAGVTVYAPDTASSRNFRPVLALEGALAQTCDQYEGRIGGYKATFFILPSDAKGFSKTTNRTSRTFKTAQGCVWLEQDNDLYILPSGACFPTELLGGQMRGAGKNRVMVIIHIPNGGNYTPNSQRTSLVGNNNTALKFDDRLHVIPVAVAKVLHVAEDLAQNRNERRKESTLRNYFEKLVPSKWWTCVTGLVKKVSLVESSGTGTGVGIDTPGPKCFVIRDDYNDNPKPNGTSRSGNGSDYKSDSDGKLKRVRQARNAPDIIIHTVKGLPEHPALKLSAVNDRGFILDLNTESPVIEKMLGTKLIMETGIKTMESLVDKLTSTAFDDRVYGTMYTMSHGKEPEVNLDLSVLLADVKSMFELLRDKNKPRSSATA